MTAGSDLALSLVGPHPHSPRLAPSRSARAAGALSHTRRRAWETVCPRPSLPLKDEGPNMNTHVGPSLYYCRQRPTLPHSFPCSTIGGSRLNFRVRNGNGWNPAPMTTGILVAGSHKTRPTGCLGFRLRSRARAPARQAHTACLAEAPSGASAGRPRQSFQRAFGSQLRADNCEL